MQLQLNNINYKALNWVKEDNVSSNDRATQFEEQNSLFREKGFTKHNTLYFRAFDVDVNVHKFCKTLFPRYSVGVMKQPPGQTLPEHKDTFYMFAKEYNIDPSHCCRINIFLEDWQSGHYFEIEQKPVIKWKAGDAIMIKHNVPHLSGNMGMTTKYTMQVTGVLSEFKRG